MAWAGSAMFAAYVRDLIALTPDVRTSWAAPVLMQAVLFNDQVTPDPYCPRPQAYYQAGEWITGREVTGLGWAAGGYPINAAGQQGPGGTSFGMSSPGLQRSPVTLAGVAGDLIWRRNAGNANDRPGVCFHDYGGLTDVTAGTVTLLWPSEPAGVFRIFA